MHDTCYFRIANCLKVGSYLTKILCQVLKVRITLKYKSFLRASHLLATDTLNPRDA